MGELKCEFARQIQRYATKVGVAQKVVQVVGEQLEDEAQMAAEHEVPLQLHYTATTHTHTHSFKLHLTTTLALSITPHYSPFYSPTLLFIPRSSFLFPDPPFPQLHLCF